MRSFAKKICMIVGAMALAGCVRDVDVYQPVPVPEFKNTVNMKVLWKTSVGSGVHNFYSQLSPVYNELHIFAASRNGDVYALDKNDGSKVWHVDLDDEDENDDRRSPRLSGGLTIDGDSLYVTSENGYLYAIDATNGELKWKYNLGNESVSAPCTSVYNVIVLTSSGNLVAVNAETGEKVWETGGNNTMISLRGKSSPIAVKGGAIIYGTVDGKLNIVREDNGVLVQQLVVGMPRGATRLDRLVDVTNTPLQISNELYAVGYNGTLQGWLLPNLSNMMNLKYTSTQNMAYDSTDIAITDKSSHIYAIARADGSQRWVNTSLTFRGVTAPAYFGNYVVVGDFEGYLYLMDYATGDFVYKNELNDSGFYTAPLVDDKLLYIQSRDGDLYALSLVYDND
ncbi:MAG: outer membrane protein assembly factor BamB [Succinivibrionaceae bacterium]